MNISALFSQHVNPLWNVFFDLVSIDWNSMFLSVVSDI